MKFVNIGYGNVVSADKVVCVVAPGSAPVKRLMLESKETGRVIDATYGRKTRAVIVAENHIILTPLHVETIAARLNSDTHMDAAAENGESFLGRACEAKNV